MSIAMRMKRNKEMLMTQQKNVANSDAEGIITINP
jgi:hypothetical protein